MKYHILIISYIFFACSFAKGETLLFFHSEYGDYIGQGETKYFHEGDGDFYLYDYPWAIDNPIVVFSFENFSTPNSIFWDLYLESPNSQRIEKREYKNAQRFAVTEENIAGLDFSGDGRGCNEIYASFNVLEVEYNWANEITRLAVDFIQHCENENAPMLLASVRYNTLGTYPLIWEPKISKKHLPAIYKILLKK